MTIKKWYFAALFVSAFFLNNVAAQKLSMWVKAGGNFSNFSINYTDKDAYLPVFSNGRNTAFHAGVGLGIPFSEKFGLDVDILYDQKGTNFETVTALDAGSSGSKILFTSSQTLNYIDIPLMFKYTFGGEDAGFFVMAGPYLGFALSGTLSSSSTLTNGTAKNSASSNVDLNFGDKINAHYKGFDAGFGLGIGGYFALSETSKIRIDLRYMGGASNIINDKYNYESYTDKNGIYTNQINNPKIITSAKNNTFQISVGYVFEIEGRR